MATIEQSDFGGGVARGRKAPADSVYDAVNAVIRGDGALAKRGGSSYLSASNAAEDLAGIASVYMPGPGAVRTLAWGHQLLYVLDAALAPVFLFIGTLGRPAAIGDVLVFPFRVPGLAAANELVFYGGSLQQEGTLYNTGTVTVTAGSADVTGVGTLFAANVDAGMILGVDTPGGHRGVVRRVVSDTALTLARPWTGPTFIGVYALQSTLYTTLGTSFDSTLASVVATAGTRLLFANGSRVYVSPPGDPWKFNATDYHELPSGMTIVGMEGIGDTAVVFGTTGVWTIANLSLDLVDDVGNPQQQVQRLNGDVILWGEDGIVSWNGNLVVPAIDDVHLLSLDGSSVAITGTAENEKVRSRYRSYTATAGCSPGTACVHRGHFFLPILNGTTVVDTLVCRLDRGAAWTRWAGHASGGGYAVQAGSALTAARLLATKAKRILDLSSCLDAVGPALDADGSTPVFTVDTSDYDTGPGLRPSTVEKVRAVYESTGAAPTVTVSSAVGPDGAAFSPLTLVRGGGASDGTDLSAWRAGRKAERIRFRFQSVSGVTSLVLRRFEVTIRQAGQT